MKKFVTNLALVCTLTGIGAAQYAHADVSSQQADQLFDLAEQVFPDFFRSSGLPTLIFLPDYPHYRGPYPEAVFVGVADDEESSIFVTGGDFGSELVNVGIFSEVFVLLQNNVICDRSNAPEDAIYSRVGNVVNVTTEADVFVVAENLPLCGRFGPRTAGIPKETGISVLSTIIEQPRKVVGVSPRVVEGVSVVTPDSAEQEILNELNTEEVTESSFCTINANTNFAPSTININVGYDITELTREFLLPNLVVDPLVTTFVQSTQTNLQVANCAEVEPRAQTIINRFTGDIHRLQEDNETYLPPLIP